MESSKRGSGSIDPEVRVRSNTGAAAFTGALLAVIGFFWFSGPLDTDLGLLLAGKRLLHSTLCMGGLLMIAIAAWCSIGAPIALLMHAIFGCVIGILLITSAVLMLTADGFIIGSLLAAVFGIILITMGLRDFHDFRGLPVELDEEDLTDEIEGAPAFDEPFEESPFIDPFPATTREPSTRKRRQPGSTGSPPGAPPPGMSEQKRRTRR